jgi:serine/threonine protein phosphatase 1
MHKIKNLPANVQGRDFVCGDIHGSYSCVNAFMNGVNFDKAVDRLISVGDLIDRGPENEKCLSLLNEPWFHSVKGNHEELMEGYFSNEIPGIFFWQRNGGSWGVEYKGGIDEVSDSIGRIVYEKIMNLPNIITVELPNGGRYHVIHAELYSSEKITDADLSDPEIFKAVSEYETDDGRCISWGRFMFQRMYKKTLDDAEIKKIRQWSELERPHKHFGQELSMIYSGHTIIKRPIQFYCQTNLDTMAYGSYDMDAEGWEGLTVAEPISNRFWFANDKVFKETTPVIFKKEENVT